MIKNQWKCDEALVNLTFAAVVHGSSVYLQHPLLSPFVVHLLQEEAVHVFVGTVEDMSMFRLQHHGLL